MIDPKTFAHSTLQLLQSDPRRYRDFGVWWYFVKRLMKTYYTRENLHLLGDHMDAAVIDRMPAYTGLQDALDQAIAEFRQNTAYNMGRNEVADLGGGGTFQLVDPDAGGL